MAGKRGVRMKDKRVAKLKSLPAPFAERRLHRKRRVRLYQRVRPAPDIGGVIIPMPCDPYKYYRDRTSAVRMLGGLAKKFPTLGDFASVKCPFCGYAHVLGKKQRGILNAINAELKRESVSYEMLRHLLGEFKHGLIKNSGRTFTSQYGEKQKAKTQRDAMAAPRGAGPRP